MISWLKDLFRKTISSTKRIIISVVLIVLYIAIACVSFIQIDCDYTSPGCLNNVSSIIKTEDSDLSQTKRIYTIAVYTKTQMSLMQYFLAKLDKNVTITKTTNEKDFSDNETYKMNVCAKNQSIQDALITAYTYAKNNSYDVNLVYDYVGVCVCAVPATYYQTGPESIQIGDIVTKIGNKPITDMYIFRDCVENIYDQYESNNKNTSSIDSPDIEVIRNNETITLTNCAPMVLVNLGYYSSLAGADNVSEYLYYNYYNIDYVNSKPAIAIETASSIGPSGGLMEAIFIYDNITGGSLCTDDKCLVGTGTISTDGSVGAIGALEQKLKTATYYLVSTYDNYFFIPYDNYYNDTDDDGNKIDYEAYINELNPCYKTVIVETFDDALQALLGGN